jgi:hypothetical protein
MKQHSEFLNYIWYRRGWAGKAITLSIAAHLALLIASSSIIVLRARFSPPAQFVMPPPPPRPALDPHKLEMRAKVQDLQKQSARPKLAPRIVANRPSDIALPEIKKLAETVTTQVKRDHSALGVHGFGVGIGGGFGTGLGGGMGGGGLPVMLSGRCDPVQRLKRLQDNGGDSACETAVVKGLKWLAANQNQDGSWGKGEFRCAMTGLALLAFLGHCETPDVGQFTETVFKAINYLIAFGESHDGRLSPHQGNAYPYEHGIATYALAEAYSMTQDAKIEPVLRKSINIILNGQTSDGGWEYNYASSGIDMSVLGWNFQALKAAQLTGLKIDGVDKALNRGLSAVRKMQDNKSGHWFYKLGNDRISPSLTGVGVLCMAFMKQARTNPARMGCEAVITYFPPTFGDPLTNLYGWYYATQACFQYGGMIWSKWRRVFQKELIKNQNDDGSWQGQDPWNQHMQPDDNIYSTALCILMLEVYYRYLPTTT